MENSKEPGKKKVKEEDLDTVSGGCGKKKEIVFTQIECQNCNHTEVWQGNYLGKVYKCPHCGQKAFRGIKVTK